MEKFFAICILAGCIPWARWYFQLARFQSFPSARKQILVLCLLPPVCVYFLADVIRRYGSSDVRSDYFWIAFYIGFGAAWLWVGLFCLRVLGISMREDALERRNNAALVVVVGAAIAITLCFSGANIGSGPGPHVVLVSSAIPTLSLFLLWFTWERICNLADRVTIDRDVFLGIRIAGWFAGTGCILGISVSGDWTSFQQTIHDFVRCAYPSLVLWTIAALAEWMIQGKTKQKAFSMIVSLILACGYLATGIAYAVKIGIHS